MSMFAHMLQKPWEKLAVVLCLVSKQGSGKGIVLNKSRSDQLTLSPSSPSGTDWTDFSETLEINVL